MGASRLGLGLAAAAVLALAVAAPVFAADTAGHGAGSSDNSVTDNPPTKSLPKALQDAVKSGQVDVVKSFPTDAPGLTGYLVKQSGSYHVVYGDQGYIVVGNLISPAGDDMSGKYEKQYAPKANLAQVVQKLNSDGHLITQGPSSAPEVYVFADPNCIYCHRFYQHAEPLAKAGKIQIHWALVGFLKPTSPGRAAAIISAKDPVAALEKNENGFNEKVEEGAIKPDSNISDSLKKLLKEHSELMSEAGGNGTPTLIYKDNGQWTMQVGAPGTDWLKSHIAKEKS